MEYTEEQVLKIVDSCFHMYASHYRTDARDCAKEIMKGMINKALQQANDVSSEKKALHIDSVIARFNAVNKERTELNNQIKAHYEPLLTEAGKSKDRDKFGELLSGIPDCPFLMTAYRMQDLYEL